MLMSCFSIMGYMAHHMYFGLVVIKVNIFFSERIVAVWNNLEYNTVDFSNIKHFKMSLLSCDLSRYTRL